MTNAKKLDPSGPPKDADGYTHVADALPMLGTVCLVKRRATDDKPMLAVYHCEGNAENLDDYHWTWHDRIARVTDEYITHWKCVMQEAEQALLPKGERPKITLSRRSLDALNRLVRAVNDPGWPGHAEKCGSCPVVTLLRQDERP